MGSLARRFADAVLTRWPDPAGVASQVPTWEYNHGIVLRGIAQVYLRSSDERYLAYVRRFVDQSVRADGRLDIPAAHSFDNLQPSVLLPLLFERTGQARYKTAADSVRARYDTIPRNADRGFWHKQQYPNQMWLDSAYMGLPFLSRYAAVFGGCESFCYDTIAEQMLLMADHLRDPATGLLYHAWDDSPRGQKVSWADAETGRSPAVWGRGLGWYAMALVDLLADLPAAHPKRQAMLDVLGALAAGLERTQDAKTGLWYQVVDQGSRTDNWLESSGSGMFVYALKVGADRGYIDEKYRAIAEKGYQGLMSQVSMEGNLPSIRGAVRGMGVQDNYAAYIDQMTLTNSPHGLCAILLASSEMDLR